MRLTMLGTGHAMVTECYNTCFLISDDRSAGLEDGSTGTADTHAGMDGKSTGTADTHAGRDGKSTGPGDTDHLLVDCGGGNGLLRQLRLAGVDPCDIRDVFVTHRHLDHITGALWLLRVWTQLMLRGDMEGEVRVYAHDEVCAALATMARLLLNDREAQLVGKRIRLVELRDREEIQVIGRRLMPFDIHSTKAKQFGFRLELSPGHWLTCCGDEPLPHELFDLACDSDWLLHEAFCAAEDLAPELLARMHHSSVTDAATTAQQIRARNLVLYHSSDKDLPSRRERYLAEGHKVYDGTLYAPYDLEVIDLDTDDPEGFSHRG